jgi:uncharacterized protein YjbI with pentapeptide repeats
MVAGAGLKVARDPKDIGELQKALNDAAAKASILWTTFVSLELYLAITFGAVTHRTLFLEDPLKLPILNVELPLVGFFVIAPTLLVIFHFYIALQILALAAKACAFDALLSEQKQVATMDQYMRHRLDAFLILQFLAGPQEQRGSFGGFALRSIAWVTLVAAPIVILLQGQVTFLPYHLEWVVWWQRVHLALDVCLIWYFWNRIRSSDEPFAPFIPAMVWQALGSLGTLAVLFFSFGLATFPGELIYRPLWLRAWLFEGKVNGVTGRPESWFSNRLVLTDQSFVDAEKIGKIDFGRSMRGRDLRYAVFNGADLRKTDFTGAMLTGAEFRQAKLQNARFGCLDRTEIRPYQDGPEERWPGPCTHLRMAVFDEAWLTGADFKGARLQGANMRGAKLEGADFAHAAMQGTSLDFSVLSGARFNLADLRAASIKFATAVGADFSFAQLQGATLMGGGKFDGSNFGSTNLQGADLTRSSFLASEFKDTELQGSVLYETDFDGAYLHEIHVWRARGSALKKNEAAELGKFEDKSPPWQTGYFLIKMNSFSEWERAVLKDVPEGELREAASKRLTRLDSSLEEVSSVDWPSIFSVPANDAKSPDVANLERQKKLAPLLVELACSPIGAPYLARAIVGKELNGALVRAMTQIEPVAQALRRGRSDPANCQGVKGFTDDDWAQLDQQVSVILRYLAPLATYFATLSVAAPQPAKRFRSRRRCPWDWCKLGGAKALGEAHPP